MLKAFKLQMETNTGARSFAKWIYTFPELDLPSMKVIRRQMRFLSGLVPIPYDCCRNACICYCGPFADDELCPICDQPRYKPNGKPALQFHYLPLIPQLRAMFAGRVSAKAMRYRGENHHEHVNDPTQRISDIYDSELYRNLLNQRVVVNGHVLDHKYFSGIRDILLVHMTDGFQLWRRSNKSGWPLLLLNSNLPFSSRFRRFSVISLGVIPGPNKPKNMDSFMFLVADELNKLAVGVRTYDAYGDEMFPMRAYAPFGSADMPAAAAAHTGGKIPGGKKSCRTCPIEGIRIAGTDNLSHYVPLVRPPGYPPHPYSHNLPPPLRHHREYIAQANLVDTAATDTEMKRLSTLFGINGTPMTAYIPGVSFPWSFPPDLMHLLENTLKLYVLHFTGNFKGLDAGREDYILPKNIQQEIGAATVAGNATIPSRFGRSIPNPITERSFFTAEAWVIWSTLYAPILFRRRFTRPKYYTHFCRFISIINRLTSWCTTKEQRDQLRLDIKIWYKEYEE